MRLGSPCINLCVLDPEARICMGCGRTLVEIGGWPRFSPDERGRVAGELSERLRALKRRRPA